MPKVMIDGIEYVPKVDPAPLPDESDVVAEAVRELTAFYWLYSDRSLCRGGSGCIWRTLELLAPNVAALVRDDPGAAYRATHPEDAQPQP